MKPKVFLTRAIPESAISRLQEHTRLTMNTNDRVLSKEELIDGVAGQDGLLCLLTDKIDGAVMDASPYLKIIADYAVGFNNIDIEAATSRGIPVSNTPGVLTETTADMAFALMLAAARRVAEADRYIRSGKWKGWGPMQFLGTDISRASLGIIGMGRIGQAVARRAVGFGMKIYYWNRTRLSEEEESRMGVAYGALEEIFETCDFISLHVAYNEETHHLVNTENLSRMKSTAFLVNTSRGSVIDEKALVEALRQKRLAGAGLDVFENEPEVASGLLSMDQVVLAPHLGSATLATRTRMAMIAIENLLAVLSGKHAPNIVNRAGLEARGINLP